MANLRDVRLRIRAIRQTLQVTKAMNLISTAKLRKGRRMLEDTEPYFGRILKLMFDILSRADKVQSGFFREPDPSKPYKTAVIVMSSDKGLAGGYNANIFRQTQELCERVTNPQLILVGSIGSRYFAHTSHAILKNFTYHSQMPTVDHAGEIAEFIISQYLRGAFDEIHVVYTLMHSAVKLEATGWQILPLSLERIQEELSSMGGMKRVELQFEFVPSEEEVFDALVPLYIRGIIYGCMVEAYVSEQSARMAAMDEASKSAEDMLDSLQISYNRARQAGITQEMSEIVGGSAALSDK
jgi:F-type H+-transporting ATPase subunit gamma